MSEVFQGLDQATAESEAQFYRDSGATAEYVSDGTGTFTLTITYPDAPAPAPAPAGPPGPGPAAPAAPPPTQMGYVLSILRLRCELRAGMDYPRTVGIYQGFNNRVPIAGNQGYCVERQGPGDNSQTGVDNHRRIAAGTYQLFTQDDGGRYLTIGYPTPGALTLRPWPCVRVDGTGARTGILIHCAAGYLMSTGCINLTDAVANANTNLDFDTSWSHVVELIDSISENTPNFPTANNVQIPDCTLVITGEPDLQLSAPVAADQDDLTADLKAAIQYAVQLNEIGHESAYRLCFAGKGNSGASFGAMQGDLAAGQPIVTSTFQKILQNAGHSADDIQTITAQLSVHLFSDPLTAAQTDSINAALLANKSLVDAMDQVILQGIFSGLDKCISAASSANKHIEPIALIYMALWINMTGPPTRLLTWLEGGDPGMEGAPVLGGAVGEDDMKGYLGATSYFRANPGNLPNTVNSAEAGALKLQTTAVA
jgi:hypothetical protein